jgi:hypothetical protein
MDLTVGHMRSFFSPVMKSMIGLAFIALLSSAVYGQQNFTIGDNSVGGVRIGMTIRQARRVLKYCRLKRDTDGEGIALIGVRCSRKEVMTLYAGESDVDGPIDENARIEFIEVWDSRFKTAHGVHTGMHIAEAERRIGKVKRIELTQIESREFVTFSQQPKQISYRIYGGIYKPGQSGQSVTLRYKPRTTIHSIQVSRH